MSLNRRHIMIIIALILTTIASFAIYTYVSRVGKVAVTMAVAPSDAIIEIGGKRVGSNSTVYLEKGMYTVNATRNGFKSASNRVSVESSENTVTMLLTPSNEEGRNYMSSHQAEFIKVEGKAGENARKEGQKFNQNNPILSILPHEGVLFSINYRKTDEGRLILEVSAITATERSLAIDYIERKGYDPTDYTIDFIDLPEEELLGGPTYDEE